MRVVAVALLGAAGAVARHLLTRVWRSSFPWSIVAINLAGAFALGVVAKVADTGDLSSGARVALGSGLLGGFTTFSTLARDTVQLGQLGAPWRAAGNLVGSLAAGVLVAAAGYALA